MQDIGRAADIVSLFVHTLVQKNTKFMTHGKMWLSYPTRLCGLYICYLKMHLHYGVIILDVDVPGVQTYDSTNQQRVGYSKILLGVLYGPVGSTNSIFACQ